MVDTCASSSTGTQVVNRALMLLTRLRRGEESTGLWVSDPPALVAERECLLQSHGPGVLRPSSHDGDHALGGVCVEGESSGLTVVANCRCIGHHCLLNATWFDSLVWFNAGFHTVIRVFGGLMRMVCACDPL